MRVRNWLLGVGLLGATVWSFVVSASMPSWFDPSEDCALTASSDGVYGSSAGIDIRTSWFPPRAVCDFGSGEKYEFISQAESVTLTVLAVVLALALVAGLVLAVRGLTATGGVIRAADAINLRRRLLTHLAVAAFLGYVASSGLVIGQVIGIMLTGPPGLVTLVVGALVVLTAVTTAADRAYGPLPSTATDSYRRGTTAAVLVVLVVTTIAVVNFPLRDLDVAIPGAATYAAVVAVQWFRPRRSSLPVPADSPATADRSAEPR
ncbi:hypothetical protein [Kribbella amoyensis]|uniref:hypothetical protein n=1 Tax=Kribbella amoyensis TaxID=996641 RepID=UPI0011A7B409|nr:hypothetical protein [Kribbella amoyensis]